MFVFNQDGLMTQTQLNAVKLSKHEADNGLPAAGITWKANDNQCVAWVIGGGGAC